MSDVERISASIGKAIDMLTDVGKHFGRFTTSDGIGWDLKQAKLMLPALIGLLPFQSGDRVMLRKEHPCPGNWDRCKHFLTKGAEGTIESIGYYDDRGFYADVVFDDETWIDTKGKRQPVSQKHTFLMEFQYLAKVGQ